jgi:hypothetical protein
METTMSKKQMRLELARQLQEAWDDNEEHMGEQAAYHVSCEQLGIDPDDGYELLAELAEEEAKAEGRGE